MKFAKPRRFRSRAFLEFVKGRGCVAVRCSRVATDPHHVQTRGAFGSDLLAIPLCRGHHVEIHKMGVETFERLRMPASYQEVSLTLLIEFVESLPEALNAEPYGRMAALSKKHWAFVVTGDTYSRRGWFGSHDWEFDPGDKCWSKDWSLSLPWDPDVYPVLSMEGVMVSMLTQGGVNGDRDRSDVGSGESTPGVCDSEGGI